MLEMHDLGEGDSWTEPQSLPRDVFNELRADMVCECSQASRLIVMEFRDASQEQPKY